MQSNSRQKAHWEMAKRSGDFGKKKPTTFSAYQMHDAKITWLNIINTPAQGETSRPLFASTLFRLLLIEEPDSLLNL